MFALHAIYSERSEEAFRSLLADFHHLLGELAEVIEEMLADIFGDIALPHGATGGTSSLHPEAGNSLQSVECTLQAVAFLELLKPKRKVKKQKLIVGTLTQSCYLFLIEHMMELSVEVGIEGHAYYTILTLLFYSFGQLLLILVSIFAISLK